MLNFFGEGPYIPKKRPFDDDASPRDDAKRKSRDADDVSFYKLLSFLLSPSFTDNNTSETPDVDDDFLHIDKKPKREERFFRFIQNSLKNNLVTSFFRN